MDTITGVFLMGLLGGVHCLGMCGGVVGLLTSALPTELRADSRQVLWYHLNYNIGRMLSYILMGTLFGLAGGVLSDFLKMGVFDLALRMFSGVLMVLVGLYIGNWYAGIQVLEKMGAKFWVKLQPIRRKFLPVTCLKQAFLLGLLWGGMPCGLVYGALSFAMFSGSFVEGGTIMLAFGMGTLPSLLLMAGFSSQLNEASRRPVVRKLSGVLIIVLGLVALWMPVKSLFY
ncbi:Heavy-metal-associated domain (N-terminus) and membrane-bounded cytochrome biogenesis cycZ-like domain, possible membrane copper tolerance protein [hydrothermal vent metagenome]|uniref:Heavy-metal-associated domain (N-terminus) and membrane-bounded cytochrome biogenesis cycZ-like domain, possible membrane copper tolerance protein n=1 Tax=hydrothermal vent metagenome TaxID=652676 RepID=A0A1W1DUJ2_9ZZZZ